MTDDLLIRRAEVQGRVVDVRVDGATVVEVGADLPRPSGARVVDARGGALLPGLHDHHLHLLATAAARTSVRVGPDDVAGPTGLAEALRRADGALPPGRWLRAVGYHDAVAGDLDREALDALVPHRPARVQHRSGARWTLNSAAIDALGLERDAHPGLERVDGRLTGRLHRSDDWLRERLPADGGPHLAPLGADLRRLGVTGVTDATPFPDRSGLDALAGAVGAGDLPLRVVAMGGPALAGTAFPAVLEQGPVKIVIDDGSYPSLDELHEQMALAHRHHRPVAVHCVTRVALVLALAAWKAAGSRAGDRVEHGSVVPPELHATIAGLGLTVVTQPGFVAERGDQYAAEVDSDDLPHLYPCRSLLRAGIAVGGSTDAPYTDIDPWAAMRAAVSRRTRSGARLGASEAVEARRALRLFLGEPHRPGGPPRTVAVGQRADLCLLGVPLADALGRLRADDVVWTCVGGVGPA